MHRGRHRLGSSSIRSCTIACHWSQLVDCDITRALLLQHLWQQPLWAVGGRRFRRCLCCHLQLHGRRSRRLRRNSWQLGSGAYGGQRLLEIALHRLEGRHVLIPLSAGLGEQTGKGGLSDVGWYPLAALPQAVETRAAKGRSIDSSPEEGAGRSGHQRRVWTHVNCVRVHLGCSQFAESRR